jgi:hypothetical protein
MISRTVAPGPVTDWTRELSSDERGAFGTARARPSIDLEVDMDLAAKAPRELAVPHLLGSPKGLERAVERSQAGCRSAIENLATGRGGRWVTMTPAPCEGLEAERDDEAKRGAECAQVGSSDSRGAGAGGRGQFGTPSGRAALAPTGPAPRGATTEGKGSDARRYY